MHGLDVRPGHKPEQSVKGVEVSVSAAVPRALDESPDPKGQCHSAGPRLPRARGAAGSDVAPGVGMST